MATARRRKIGHRRRLEDEGDDEGGPEAFDLDDDSLSDGSGLTDDNDAGNDSDTSNVEDASPTSTNARKARGPGISKGTSNGSAKPSGRSGPASHPLSKPVDTELMLRNLTINDGSAAAVDEMHFDDAVNRPATPSNAPVVVSSASATRPPPQDAGGDRRRREHEEYKRRRDEDPSFVPNRGAFFMHDHRHAGPAANGFRPFPRPTRGRGGRGGFGGSFGGHFHQLNQHPNDPTTSGQWTHDMHQTIADPVPPRPSRGMNEGEGPPNGNGIIPTCPQNSTPINRTLSTEKHIGNAQVRVFFPGLEKAVLVRGLQVKQYTKLPDHRPPLRRDKPVRISLPDRPPRYIFPAVDRSFIFIPRAMRPNQKPSLRGGKTRSVLGSVGGWSRRTSAYGGSYYAGSAYSPSIAMSRRSSLAPDGRDYLFSPTGSVVSRPPVPPDPFRPIVRLPPQQAPPPMAMVDPQTQSRPPPMAAEPSISNLPPPQTHPLPQKPSFQETQPHAIPMHQPRPQKTVSVADIESPTLHQHPQPTYQGAFHQQVPVQVSNGFPPDHSRQPSYQSQHSTGTPLSQIPERAIHAAPFQPNYGQQGYYNQPYPVMQPQQGYYYAPPYGNGGMQAPPSATAPTFVPTGQHGQAGGYPQNPQEMQPPQVPTQPAGQNANQNLIAQEVNGTYYFYDPSQLPPVQPFTSYPGQQGFVSGVPMGNVVNPSPAPEGYYPYQATPGMMYYPQ